MAFRQEKCWVQRALVLNVWRYGRHWDIRGNSAGAWGGRLRAMGNEAGGLGCHIPNHGTWPSPCVENDPLI